MKLAKDQGGYAVATGLAVTALLIAFIYAAFTAEVTEMARNQNSEQKTEWLLEANTALHLWYERNKMVIDANADPITIEEVTAGSGLTMQYGAQFQSTPLLTNGAVSYHIFAIWVPEGGISGTGFDSAGIFQQGTDEGGVGANLQYTLIDGSIIELKALRDTLKQQQKLLKQFEVWFKARAHANPTHGIDDNYFRATDCADVSGSHLPCVNDYTSLDDPLTDDVRAKVGFSVNDSRDAWGNPMEFTNLSGLPASPPYAVGLQTTPPWGTPVNAISVVSDL